MKKFLGLQGRHSPYIILPQSGDSTQICGMFALLNFGCESYYFEGAKLRVSRSTLVNWPERVPLCTF